MITISSYLRSKVVEKRITMSSIAEKYNHSRSSLSQYLKNNAPTLKIILEIVESVDCSLEFRYNDKTLKLTLANTVKKDEAEEGDFSTELRYLIESSDVRIADVAAIRGTASSHIYKEFKQNCVPITLLMDLANILECDFGIADHHGGFFKITSENTNYRKRY